MNRCTKTDRRKRGCEPKPKPAKNVQNHSKALKKYFTERIVTVCVLEIAMEDGTWEYVGARAFRGDAIVRPAEHDWEFIPPCYARCRACGAVMSDERAAGAQDEGGE